jgi:hypothetical protein
MMNRLTIVALLSLISLFDPALGQINKNKAVPEDAGEHFDKPDSTVVAYPNGDIYRAGKFKRFWFGNNYREEWVTPIEIPLFDFRNEKGEMKIIKEGGSFQTSALRLEDEEGKEWVLRSLDKNASAVIPENIRTGMAEDIVQDQMSASNPYGAFAVPGIAEAAGILHTNPRLVYLDIIYLPAGFSDKWEGIYLFEERPDGNRSDVASFGHSEKIVSTSTMIEKVTGKIDLRVDQKLFLKSRLVDMLISDWDRHEDQWRWAFFEENGSKVYKPVPRDRDMAFFVSEGVLPWLSTRKFLLRKIQGLDYDIKDIRGLNSQAQHLDRRFLNELTRDDWNSAAGNLRESITDEVIDSAVNDMPQQIAAINGNAIASKLRARRDSLEKYADEYYSILAVRVDIAGSDQDEFFSVERLNDTETRVRIYNKDDKGDPDKIYYERTFIYPETKEIMLYGLGGNDFFKVSGKVNKGIKIRIVGGRDKDEIRDESKVNGIERKTIVYEDTVKTKIVTSGETRKVISTSPGKYSYNYHAFNYNKFIPILYTGYSYDDGVYLGSGFTYTTYDFTRKPFAARHTLLFKYSMATDAKELTYKGIYTDFLNIADVQLKFHVRDPKFTQNYFGSGNETIKSDTARDYYRVRIGEFFINPELSFPFNSRTTFYAGIFYQNSRVEATKGRFISDLISNDLNSGIFSRKEFIGVSAGINHDSRNNVIIPSSGFYWEARNQFHYGLSGSDNIFDRVSGEIRFYAHPWKSAGHVIAFRAGGAVNAGSYDFFQANTLGSLSELRGFAYNRYSGYASFYQNSDLRIKLSRVRSYVTRGYFGLILFNDLGRVWEKNEDSHKWHHGYGGGLWVSPYEMTIITAMYEFSRDEKEGLFSLRLGFLF